MEYQPRCKREDRASLRRCGNTAPTGPHQTRRPARHSASLRFAERMSLGPRCPRYFRLQPVGPAPAFTRRLLPGVPVDVRGCSRLKTGSTDGSGFLNPSVRGGQPHGGTRGNIRSVVRRMLGAGRLSCSRNESSTTGFGLAQAENVHWHLRGTVLARKSISLTRCARRLVNSVMDQAIPDGTGASTLPSALANRPRICATDRTQRRVPERRPGAPRTPRPAATSCSTCRPGRRGVWRK